MRSVIVSITIPEPMLRIIDQAAAAEYQTRSNFLRMCVVEHFGLNNQSQLEGLPRPPRKPTGKELFEAYDFQEEYDEIMKYLDERDKEDS